VGDNTITVCVTTLTALAKTPEDVTLFPKTVNNELRNGPLLAKMAANLGVPLSPRGGCGSSLLRP